MMIIVICCDSIISDDEPLWEPIEWSLWQTWLLFIFIFGWTAEVLITSSFGSFTGRDKRVWLVLYKIYWWVEFYLALSLGLLAIFAIIPFYFEQYSIAANWISFWIWYDKIFLWKNINLIFIALYYVFLLQLNTRWNNVKTNQWLITIIFCIFSYLTYSAIITLAFIYFTNPTTYNNFLDIDYSQLSHGPNKWGWGMGNRDHFSYHSTPQSFWIKYEYSYISVLLFVHLFYTFNLILLYWQIIIFIRKLYSQQYLTYTYVTYVSNSIRQYFYWLSMFYLFNVISFIFLLLRNVCDFYVFKYGTSHTSVMATIRYYHTMGSEFRFRYIWTKRQK